MAQSKFIYLGVRGSVMALNSADGRQCWATTLKGADFVNVLLDGNNLYAATRGELFCLDPKTGKLRWNNPLKGYGWGLVSLAAEGVAPDNLAISEEKRRRERQTAAGAAAVTSP